MGAASTRSPFRAAEHTVVQDWASLSKHLAAAGRHLQLDEPPRQFAGGLANLNYLVTVDGHRAVLRRPPAGQLAEGASDMAREWRVLSRLGEALPLVPRGLHFCADPDVLGAPFQLVEFRAGEPVGGRLPDTVAGRDGATVRITSAVVGAMAALHEVDPERVGLGDLGRPEGFFRRQTEGWARRADVAWKGQPPPAVSVVVEHLRRCQPRRSDVSLLHADLKPDNVLFDLDTLEPVAVVDWDMATRGDPLFDLAVLLSYWVEPDDPEALHGLQQVPSLEPGAPRRRDIVERYAARSGRSVEGLGPHLVLARLRLAVAWQQLFRLYQRGDLTDPRYAAFPAVADSVLRWTADTLDNPLR